jgi:hypothetical protein
MTARNFPGHDRDLNGRDHFWPSPHNIAPIRDYIVLSHPAQQPSDSLRRDLIGFSKIAGFETIALSGCDPM